MSDPATRRAWLEVDHGAVAHNVRELGRVLAPDTELMAIVKADAYGHGMVSVARTVLAHGASFLGVATADEGIELRQAEVKTPILILGYVSGTEAVDALTQWHLIPTVCSADHSQELSESVDRLKARGVLSPTVLPLAVHMKLDTGMTRLGTQWDQAVEFSHALKACKNLRLAGVYSHLAAADSADPQNMLQQAHRFERALAQLRACGCQPACVHLANSAATLADTAFHYDLVRVGLALYGIWPAAHLSRRIDLWPALSMRSRLTQIKDIREGSGISYGSIFVADRPMRIAVASAGYADGIPWRLSQHLTALIHGRRVRQLGRITMDQLILDVSSIPDVRSGEIVTFLGKDGDQRITVEDWAEALETIPWEVLCLFRRSLPHVVVNGLEDE